MNQHELILKYLRDFGSITPYEAFRDLGITKLATRISEMRKKGYEFNSEWITTTNRYGQEVKYKKYSAANDNQKPKKRGFVWHKFLDGVRLR